jgi:hypothetical protein
MTTGTPTTPQGGVDIDSAPLPHAPSFQKFAQSAQPSTRGANKLAGQGASMRRVSAPDVPVGNPERRVAFPMVTSLA